MLTRPFTLRWYLSFLLLVWCRVHFSGESSGKCTRLLFGPIFLFTDDRSYLRHRLFFYSLPSLVIYLWIALAFSNFRI